jgi:hypothetical protein
MRILTAAVILATAASTTAAFAQSDRLTDTQYISAARCAGLMQGADTTAIDEVARKAAASKARKANGPGSKAEVAREIAGACTAFTS